MSMIKLELTELYKKENTNRHEEYSKKSLILFLNTESNFSLTEKGTKQTIIHTGLNIDGFHVHVSIKDLCKIIDAEKAKMINNE